MLRPISKRDNRTKGISITIGVDGRMYLSRGFQDALGHKERTNYYLFYDEIDNRIGLSKQQPDDNIEPFAFNSKGEGQVAGFVEDCELQMPGKPVTWLYEGKDKDVFVFYQQGRKMTSFKQEKNGNLERIG